MDRDVPAGRPLCSRPVEDLLLLLGGNIWLGLEMEMETGRDRPSGAKRQAFPAGGGRGMGPWLPSRGGVGKAGWQ